MLDHQLKAFVTKNQHYYLPKSKRTEPYGRKSVFNLTAFFLTIYWLAYRRMYAQAFIVFGITVIPITILTSINAPQWLVTIESLLVSLSIAIVYGVLGNRFYYNHAKKKIERLNIQADHLSSDDEAAIAGSGGTSAAGVVAMAGLAFIYLIVVTVLTIFSFFNSIGSIEFGEDVNNRGDLAVQERFEQEEPFFYGADFAEFVENDFVQNSVIYVVTGEEVMFWEEYIEEDSGYL
ncbi:DUF2628 domain-containing protein [Jeotgalibacillus soli]|uniref:DUF2628 domain-containing protein n=1 Tax=Jeotgalibacillus soli TaxID=889306 RepID=A0A0C2R0X5_9BACL|nr:DUF2628 domain-containing protein [Jeotgalibacillus soli]KIL43955.1 hypothetical protein KP78_37790 [Jeotgalibacillus soli]